MTSVLVITAEYPTNDGKISRMFIHVRNKYYLNNDIEVSVVNFDSKKDYELDGIKVFCPKSYAEEHKDKKYDILISHASNLRNNYIFLKKYGSNFNRFIFFFHGHEVLKLSKEYPIPYDYTNKNSPVKRKLRDSYDWLKFKIWHGYYKKNAYKSDFVFVSNWLLEKFKYYIKLNKTDLKNHVHIINNSVGEIFETNSYNIEAEKKYDFITIRSYMDDSKYCVDLVCALAKRYPDYKFLIIGKGKYFDYNEQPKNVEWVNRFLFHEEMLNYINESRCGLLLTREDTQGVMTCELSAYGIPVITSDIDVCREICNDLPNVRLISNNPDKVDLNKVYHEITADVLKGKIYRPKKYSYDNTVKKEVELIKALK